MVFRSAETILTLSHLLHDALVGANQWVANAIRSYMQYADWALLIQSPEVGYANTNPDIIIITFRNVKVSRQT